MKTFVIFQFKYGPLVWMFQSRKLNNCINSIHERALRVTNQDYKSTFLELLRKDNFVAIHQWSLQVLATEICKVKNDLSYKIMKKFFELKELSYSLRPHRNYSVRENVKTTHRSIQ